MLPQSRSLEERLRSNKESKLALSVRIEIALYPRAAENSLVMSEYTGFKAEYNDL
jgi:hypothetical protein